MSSLPTFSLRDVQGREHSFPTGRPALLCFVREDCPTCGLTMPLIDAVHGAFAGAVDVLIVGQEGNEILVDRHKLSVPMLDDMAVKTSFAYNVEIVPAIILADSNGGELARFEGFAKRDWQDMVARLSQLSGIMGPPIDWSEYPDLRPGCGSKSVEPGIAERLQAEASGSRLRARRIKLGSAEDPFDFMFDQGLTDGLPVIPPTPERVLHMLTGTHRDPQEVVATAPPNLVPVTAEKVAANAVMAGCKPEYLPVVIAALEAVCTDEFNIHGIMATTGGASPILIVNGPIRHRIGMNMGVQALGSGFRANATIGRALKLIMRNVGGARPGEIERSTFGGPAKYTSCYAEWEERSPWEPLHVERGFKPDENVVTVFGLQSGCAQVTDQTSRSGRLLAGSLGAALAACGHPKFYRYGEVLLVISPEHADTFKYDGFSKAQVRNRIQEVSAKRIRDLLPDNETGEGMPIASFGITGKASETQLNQRIEKFRKAENINIIVAGGEAGKFSAVFGSWFSGPMGSVSVSRKIEEAP